MTPTVLLLLLLAQTSQTPPPGPTENKVTPKQNQSNQEQAKPAADLRGTDQQPLVVRVPKTQAETDQEQNDRNEEAFNKRAALALTGFTVLVAAFQLLVLVFQNKIIRQQNAEMALQRTEMNTQTTYMRDTLTETKNSADAAKVSADAAKESSDLLAFIHRAELDCKNWRANQEWIQTANPGYTNGVSVTFTFDIKNVGKTSARLDHVVLCVQPHLPIHPFHRQPFKQDAVLSPEQAIPMESPTFVWRGEEEQLYRTTGIAVYIWGCVYFSDRLGTGRWKRFGRVCVCRDKHDPNFTAITRLGFNTESHGTESDPGEDRDDHYEPKDWSAGPNEPTK